MTQVKTEVVCDVCGTSAAALLQRGVRNRRDVDVYKCSGCGLVRLGPLPTEDELKAYYTDSYREAHEPGLAPEGAYRTELPEARARVERLRPLLGPQSSVLELGASSGAFVDSLRPFVKSAVGVEPSVRHRTWARETLGLEMLADLSDARGRRFDAVVLFHVLEHVRHPVEFLKELSGLLAPGGFLGIEVPNADDALLSAYKVPAFGPFYYQDAHLWYFNGDTLSRALKAAGLAAEVSWIQRYDLSNHLHWLGAGVPGGKGRYAGLLGPAVDAAYADALCRARVSDTLWTVARRPGQKD